MECNKKYTKLEIAAWYISILQSKKITVLPEYPYNDINDDFFEVGNRARNIWFGTRPIQDSALLEQTVNFNIQKMLTNNHSLSQTVTCFKEWFPYNIENYNVQFIDGTTEAFNSLYTRFKDKTFYLLEDEYWYHYESAKQLGLKTEPLSKNSKNGVVILSYPFSYFGEDHMHLINKNNYTVLDITYLPIGLNVKDPFTVNTDEVIFSYGKTWPIQQARAGFRISKHSIDDTIHSKNQMPLTNRLSTEIIRLLMQEISYDYIINKYRNHSFELCNLFELEQTNILTVAKTTSLKKSVSHTFNQFNKNYGDRICISSLLENYSFVTSKNFKEILDEYT